jgi:hypothetical protein
MNSYRKQDTDPPSYLRMRGHEWSLNKIEKAPQRKKPPSQRRLAEIKNEKYNQQDRLGEATPCQASDLTRL